MKAKIKHVKLLEENGEYGFEIVLSTEEGIKKFGNITDKNSFRKLFFGVLCICNNFNLSELSATKGQKISALIEKPNTLDQRIAAVGNKSKFLLSDKGDKYIIQKFNYKEMKLLRYFEAVQTGKIVSMKSASGTIITWIDFKFGSQAAVGPHIFVGMGYPLNNRVLNEEETEYVGNFSSSYIAGLIKTVLNTKYLYHEKRNKQVYEVECILDEQGNIASLGNTIEIEEKEKPIYINKYGNEYRLEATPLQIKKEDIHILKRI